uniref:Kunitz/Bovine pancreatic trypsin inhibitor domain protein n=1 Tax=Parastrongyloides trichosuri TaxID=131310 RepID=A0A0N4ZAS2_PARTI
MVNFGTEGDKCNANDSSSYAVPNSPHHFIFCNPVTGRYTKDQCAIIDGIKLTFSPKHQKCINSSLLSLKRTSPYSNFINPMITLSRCATQQQCPDDKWYCSSSGQCNCKRNYVQIESKCYRKISIESNDKCLYDKQCSSVWPTAKCIENKCTCASPQIAVQTSHGIVCTIPGECPLGYKPKKLKDDSNCLYKGGCGDVTFLGHLYDCISGDNMNPICCPNKVHTCMQPVMQGNGICMSFVYKGGDMVNSNVFYTRSDCETYCQSSCPRGFEEIDGNNMPKMCNKDSECKENYSCHKTDINDYGICCPSVPYICSPYGGREYTNIAHRTEEYDAGGIASYEINTFYPAFRYYYSVKEKRCKSFLYQGEGGNLNQFMTIDHCQRFCSPLICDGENALTHNNKIVSCSLENPCKNDFICKSKLCCPMKKKVCKNSNYEPLLKNESDSNGGNSMPVRCLNDDNCPTSYACHTTNYIGKTNNYGHCCREIKHNKSKISNINSYLKEIEKNDKMKQAKFTTLKPQITTKTLPSEYPTLIPMTTKNLLKSKNDKNASVVTSPLYENISCPANRVPLLDKNGKAVLCTIEDDLNSIKTHKSCGGSTLHSCAFKNVNSDIGLCCTNIDYSNHRCPNGMRPYISSTQVDETNDNILTPYRCSPLIENFCSTINNSSDNKTSTHKPVCIFDEIYGNYHCCEPFENLPIIITKSLPSTNKKFSFENWSKMSGLSNVNKNEEPSFISSIENTKDVEEILPTIPSITTTTESLEAMMIKNENEDGCRNNEKPFLDILKKNEILFCNINVINTCPPGFYCYESKSKKRSQCCGVPSKCPPNSGALISPVTNDTVKCNSLKGCPNSFFCFKKYDNITSNSIVSNDNKESIDDNGICCSEDPIISLCDHGIALKNFQGQGIKCDNNDCPKGYFCQHRFNISMCCPTVESVCLLPLNKGLPCDVAPPSQQYYFDIETKSCKQFTFTGCSGNNNKFESKNSCNKFCKIAASCPVGFPLIDLIGEIKTCSDDDPCLSGYDCITTLQGNYCCPREDMTCSLPVDHGTNCDGSKDFENGNEPILLWYYSIVEMTCLPFEYRGCGGNFNRFVSQQHCMNSCLPNLCLAGQPQIEHGQLIRCNNKVKCDKDYVCVESNFGSANQNVCCPRPEKLCLYKETDPQKMISLHYRYKFDETLDKCVSVLINDTHSIENTFVTKNKCESFCISNEEMCLKGSFPYRDSITSLPLSCSIIQNNCPNDFSCYIRKSGTNEYNNTIGFCCSEPALCYNGRKPLMNTINNDKDVISCTFTSENKHNCPTQYSCQLLTDGKYGCCRDSDIFEPCPYPSRPLIQSNLNGDVTVTCNEKYGINSCPFGYVCKQNMEYNEHYCCSDISNTDSENSFPFLNSQMEKVDKKSSVEPKYIARNSKLEVLTNGILGISSEMANMEIEDKYFKNSITGNCKDGTEPLIEDHDVRICNPYIYLSCPVEYHCEYNENMGRYQCCEKTIPTIDSIDLFNNMLNNDEIAYCPVGMSLVSKSGNGDPMTCTSSPIDSCPQNSRCVYSSYYWQNVCCTTDSIPFNSAQDFEEQAKLFLLKSFQPGEVGCQRDTQCQSIYSGAKCYDWICYCPKGQYIFEKSCVDKCPSGYEDREGFCAKMFNQT